MRLEIIWNQETTPLDLAEGVITVGGSSKDGIFLEGLPHALLTLRHEGGQLSVTAQRSVRIGDTLFPARVERLFVEGEDLKLPNDVLIRRVLDLQKRDSRKLVATAFVAHELLGNGLATEGTRAATFTCVTGHDAGKVFPVPFAESVIGRADDAAIRIRDRAVSRHHAVIIREGRAYALQLITSSMNGVYVNGRLCKGTTPLKTGDVVEVGQTILRFNDAERAPEERTVVSASGPAPAVLEAAAVPVPVASAPPPVLRHARVSLETVLMSAGVALSLLGFAAAALMLR